MLFRDAAEAFEGIEKASSRLEMTGLIAELFGKAEAREAKKLVYLLQGRIAPAFEKLEIGMGEKLVIEAVSRMTGIKNSEVEELYKKRGDVGLATFELVQKKKQKALFSEKLSTEKVFSNFLKIAGLAGKGSQELKIKLLAELINSASPLEAKFIVRVPLDKMRLGAGDPTIMDAFAVIFLSEFEKMFPDKKEELKEKYRKEEDVQRQLKFKTRELIEEKYNIHSDLGEIAFILKKKGLKGLQEIKIQVGVPIRPTLAERLGSGKEIIEKLGKCLVEAKYDGLRLAVHREGNRVVIFSRNQENMTEMFPEIVKSVKEQVKAESIIFEGEALAFNEDSQEFFPFQVTIQRKRKYDVEQFSEKYPLKLFVFDLLYLNGENLMNESLSRRRKKLGEVIGKGNIIDLTESITTDKEREVKEFFDLKVSQGLEGIIAKDLNAPYIAGARKFAWIKLKRSYRQELNDSIDLVVVGYYKGLGKRHQFGLGSLLTAVYDDKNDCFESVAKVATGLSEKELGEMEKLLSKDVVREKNARVKSELKPDCWVEPGIVIEVNADEITKSPMHSAGRLETGEGLALRFPRFIKLREDKKAEDATTTKELIRMFENQRKAGVEE